MRAVSAHGATVDSLRVAVLAALNIADELTELRARHNDLLRSLDHTESATRSRATSLSNMLDEALREDYRHPHRGLVAFRLAASILRHEHLPGLDSGLM